MSIKKIIMLLFCSLLCIMGLTGCSQINKMSETATEMNEEYSALTKVADHLYETTFTDDFVWSEKMTLKNINGAFSCSAIQVGQYRGRNYDWSFDDTDLCVVHATVTENRPHASVGIADLSFISDENGDFDLAEVPFYTVDGINDAGVCVQVNVMPEGENGEIPHTESADDDLLHAHVVRYILDYADSVDDIVALLKKMDIYSVFGGEELHWMISGPTSKSDKTIKTVVVEVFPDDLHITEDFVDDIPIMTNFNVSNFDGSKESVGWGLGYERWQILKENHEQADSVMGTFDLMEKTYFSKMYDLYSDRFWYSEYALTNLNKYYSDEELIEKIGQERYDFYMNNYGSVYYLPEFWDGEENIHGDISKTGIIAPAVEHIADIYKAQNLGDETWITIETSVYDLENLTLDLQVRESQDHYHFTIDQK